MRWMLLKWKIRICFFLDNTVQWRAQYFPLKRTAIHGSWVNILNSFHHFLFLLQSLRSTICFSSTACLSHPSPSRVCRKALCCASERNSPKTASLSCRCWKDILTLFDFWCRLMTSGKQTTTTLTPTFFLTSLPLAGLYPSVIDRRSSPTANLQSMTRAQSSPLCDCVLTVQCNQSLSVLPAHIHKASAPAVLSALLCVNALHTGMVEWVCISGQIGIYNRPKCVCVCVRRWGLLYAWSPPVITPSSGSRPLCR